MEFGEESWTHSRPSGCVGQALGLKSPLNGHSGNSNGALDSDTCNFRQIGPPVPTVPLTLHGFAGEPCATWGMAPPPAPS